MISALDTAAAFVHLMCQGRRKDEPIYIDMDQGDQQVQIYID